MVAVGSRQPWKIVVRPSIDWMLLVLLVPSIILVPLILIAEGIASFEHQTFRALAASATLAVWVTVVLLRQGRLLSLASATKRSAAVFAEETSAFGHELDGRQPLISLHHEQGGCLLKLLGNRYFTVSIVGRPRVKHYVDARELLETITVHADMGGLARWSTDSSSDRFLNPRRSGRLPSKQTKRSMAIISFGETNAARLLLLALIGLSVAILWGVVNESSGAIEMELQRLAPPNGIFEVFSTLGWAPAVVGPIVAPFVILLRSYLPGRQILVGRFRGGDCRVPPLLYHSAAPEGMILLTSRWGKLLASCSVGELRDVEIASAKSGTPVLRLELPNGESAELDWSCDSDTLLEILLNALPRHE